MKNIDKIIQKKLSTVLNEQVRKIPFNGKLMTPNQIAVSGLSPNDPHLSPVVPFNSAAGMPWPSTLPRKKFPGGVESFFKLIKAVPYMYSNRPMDEKNGYPKFLWNYAEETFKFYSDGTVETSSANANGSHSNHVLYWKYVPDPDAPSVRDASDINKRQAVTGKFQGRQEHTPQLQIYADGAKTKAVFTIYILPGNKPTIGYWQTKKGISDQERQRLKNEFIHSMLDIFGFVPVLGDATDLYQAAWYFGNWYNYGKKTEDLLLGTLSLVAVIPVAGDIAKGFLKPWAKRLGKFTKFGKKKAAQVAEHEELLDALRTIYANSTKELSDEQAKVIAEAIKKVANIFAKNKHILEDGADKLGMANVKELLDAIDQQLQKAAGGVDKVLMQTRKAKVIATNLADPLFKTIDDITWWQQYKGKLTSMAFDQSAQISAKAASEGIGILKKLGKFSNSKYNPLRVFSTETFNAAVTSRHAARTLKMLEKDFIKSIKDDPERAIALMQTCTGILRTKISETFGATMKEMVLPFVYNSYKAIKSNPNPTIQQISEFTYFCRALHHADGRVINIVNADIKKIRSLIDNGFKPNIVEDINNYILTKPQELFKYAYKFANGSGSEKWAGAAEKIARYCIENGHPVYNYILADPIAHIKTIFPRSYDKWDSLKMLGNNILDGKKWLDLYYNFIHDVYSDIIQPDEEHNRSFAYSSLKKYFKAKAPNWAKGTVEWANKYIQMQKSNIAPPSDVSNTYRIKGAEYDDSLWVPPTTNRAVTGVNPLNPRGKALKSNPFLKTL